MDPLRLTATQAKLQFGAVITKVKNGTPIIVEKNNQPEMVCLSIDDYEDLIDVIEDVVEAFNNMAEAARTAVTAANTGVDVGLDAACGVGAGKGLGFQSGTLGFLVPPGFPDDTFPLRVTSGERVIVAPPGRSIESFIAPRMVSGDTFHFNMTVNTMAAPQAVIQQFEVMRALVG